MKSISDPPSTNSWSGAVRASLLDVRLNLFNPATRYEVLISLLINTCPLLLRKGAKHVPVDFLAPNIIREVLVGYLMCIRSKRWGQFHGFRTSSTILPLETPLVWIGSQYTLELAVRWNPGVWRRVQVNSSNYCGGKVIGNIDGPLCNVSSHAKQLKVVSLCLPSHLRCRRLRYSGLLL